MTPKGPMIQIAGLWQKTSAKGHDYMTGTLGGAKLLIFKNPNAGQDTGRGFNEPDYNVFITPRKPQGGQRD